MHYVAIRDNGDLAGKPMSPDYVDSESDRQMVWACTTASGALWWALARFDQARPVTAMHIYETELDSATIEADPNYDIPSSVMAESGTFGAMVAKFSSADEVLTAISERHGEDDFVDTIVASRVR